MKTSNLVMTVVVVMLTMASCKNSEKENPYAQVDAYENYIDSISNVGIQDISERWDEVEKAVKERKKEADRELQSLKDNDKRIDQYRQKVYSTNERYKYFRLNVMNEMHKRETENTIQNLRNSLFENMVIGNDYNFDWVNKDNILNTYDYFVNTVSENRNNYTREEWDEIKMLYEALDSRKNTVENEGLTSGDNAKIAALKLKFAPIYTTKRLETKVKENKESKNK